MAEDGAANGLWSLARNVASGAAAVPLTITLVALGTGVLIGRALLDVIGQGWRSSPSRRRSGSGDGDARDGATRV
jgi:hypothetical protein